MRLILCSVLLVAGVLIASNPATAGPIVISGTDPITFSDGSITGGITPDGKRFYIQSFVGRMTAYVFLKADPRLVPTGDYLYGMYDSEVIGNINTLLFDVPNIPGLCGGQIDVPFFGGSPSAAPFAMLFSVLNCNPDPPPCLDCNPPPCLDCGQPPPVALPEPTSAFLLASGLAITFRKLRR